MLTGDSWLTMEKEAKVSYSFFGVDFGGFEGLEDLNYVTLF